MPVTAAIIGGGASVVGGVLAGNAAKSAAKANAQAQARAEAMYNSIDVPTVEAQKLILDRYRYGGDYSPEMLEALGLGPSAQEGVQADQAALDAQVQALQGLQEISKGGLTESDLAAARQVQRQTDNSDMARRKSILSQMAQRGTLGSGVELAAQLQSAQDSTQNQADANDKLIQSAQARALQGLSQTGDISQQMRYQSYNEGTQKATAKDAINKFNAANSQNITNQNVDNRNTAALRNLNANQTLNNSNVDLGNKEQIDNKGLLQSKFNNQLNLTNAKAGRAAATGQAQQGVGNASAAQTAAIIQGIGGAAGAYFGSPSASSSQVNTASSPSSGGLGVNTAYDTSWMDKYK